MRIFASVAVVLLFASAPVSAAERSSTRPNIVLIMSDDMGWRDLGCYGVKDIRTPQLDQLAREGVRFTRFYSNGTECSPTRTALLTGRYQHRVGGLECAIGTGNVGRYDDAARLAAQHELGLPVTETSVAQLLKKAGYATAIVGKWHLGYDDKFAPGGHGFDHALYCAGGGMDYFHHVEDPPKYEPVLRLDGKPIQRRGYFTDMIADDSINWMREQATRDARRPFFLYVPFTAPHSPFQAPDEEQPQPLPADSPRWNQGKAPPAVYAAMIESLDRAIGRILAALKEQQLDKNTVVIFTNDNGGTASARPTGLRGQKGTTFEGGVRVPCIVRWPSVLRAGTEFSHPGMTFDLTASIVRIAGTKAPAGRAFDGIDILRYAETGTAPPGRALFWRGRRGQGTWRAVRDDAFKYVSRQNGSNVEEWLFEIERDQAEEKDLLAQRPADVKRLKAKLAAWETEVRPTR
ncbi:MAG: sulfatase-like hydrolase/transferase [Opitutaceae bacterium]|nr:sulfatase-like hydrolase/transferase [Opitutaceae bacterium]